MHLQPGLHPALNRDLHHGAAVPSHACALHGLLLIGWNCNFLHRAKAQQQKQ